MPRIQGNKVAPAAALGDGFDLAAALRVRLVPLVVIAEAPGIGYGNADCRIHFWCTLKGTTPLETWLAKCHLIVPVDPAVNLAEAFRHQAARKVHRDSTITLDGVLFELPSTLIGERVVLRYDPTLPPGNRRLFVHHGGRHVGEARLVDSYANARVRRADLRLDPAGDDDNDAGGAPVARSSDPPDKRPAEGLPVVEQLELQFEAPSAAPGQPATKQSQTPDRLRSGPAGENRRTNGAGTPNGVAIPARCPVVGLPVCYRADCRHYQHGGCVHPKAVRRPPRRRRRR